MSTKHEKYVDSFETPPKYVCIEEKTRSISFGTIFHEYTIMDIASNLQRLIHVCSMVVMHEARNTKLITSWGGTPKVIVRKSTF